MRVVVDANIAFAALIKDGLTAELLFHKDLEPIAPEFIFEEVRKHWDEICEKTGRSDVETVLDILRRRITIIDADVVLGCPDPDDAPYISLAKMMNCPLWTNDKALAAASVRVLSTAELAQALGTMR